MIIDERSMISSELLDNCERNMRQTIYGGSGQKHKFGGIPVILLVGDDYQLPSVVTYGKVKLFYNMFENFKRSSRNTNILKSEANGYTLFRKFSENVLHIHHHTRQENYKSMIHILEDI